MTKWILAAGAAALAVTTPALADNHKGGKGNGGGNAKSMKADRGPSMTEARGDRGPPVKADRGPAMKAEKMERGQRGNDRVKVRDALQDWPKLLLARAIQGIDYDNGPHSLTRVQMRMRLMRDARGADDKKRAEAVQILKFMGEKGVLMALKGVEGPVGPLAKQAFFELMNPKATTETLPAARDGKTQAGGVNVKP